MAKAAVMVFAIALAISMQGALGGMMGFGHGDIRCEDLDRDSCAFSVSGTGKRCVLESRLLRSGAEEFACGTSEIVADKIANHIESDECIRMCGVDRRTLGISSDSLLDRRFAASLCSDECFQTCPNIVDLYFNLAAAEGVYLMKFCEARRVGSRRGMEETLSSSGSARDNLEALSPEASLLNQLDEAESPEASLVLNQLDEAESPEASLVLNQLYEADSPEASVFNQLDEAEPPAAEAEDP